LVEHPDPTESGPQSHEILETRPGFLGILPLLSLQRYKSSQLKILNKHGSNKGRMPRNPAHKMVLKKVSTHPMNILNKDFEN
jgi:hypothetical protein